MKFKSIFFIILLVTITYSGCISLNKSEFDHYINEAQWIRDGEPIIFEGENWYPIDIIENLLDEEVVIIETYRDEKVYIEKKEVRPYNRLYTKFGKRKYRLFEKND